MLGSPGPDADEEEAEDRGLTLNLDRRRTSPGHSQSRERRARVARSNSLQRLLSSISTEREREKSREAAIFQLDLSGEARPAHTGKRCLHGFVHIPRIKFWTQLFHNNFLNCSNDLEGSKDDLLFYVRKNAVTASGKTKFDDITFKKTSIEVHRRFSANLPDLDDPSIDWEETVYLNLILQHFEYTVTVAVCTRTGAHELEILKKFSQKVYASPSHRRMDSKGTHEEIAYPNIFFSLDNFEEVFSDCAVRDSEMVCVELIACDRYGALQGVIFLGSIRYEALKQVYDARASTTGRFALKMPTTWFKSHRRVEFMRMRGPHGKGHAEMAVSKVEGAPMTPAGDNYRSFEEELACSGADATLRRASDLSGGSGFGGHWRMWRAANMRKSRSDSENIDKSESITEVEANAVEDDLSLFRLPAEFEDGRYAGFLGRSFGQAWHWFKERRRASSVALNAYLTYITLPWHRIIADVLEVRQQPVLTFDVNGLA